MVTHVPSWCDVKRSFDLRTVPDSTVYRKRTVPDPKPEHGVKSGVDDRRPGKPSRYPSSVARTITGQWTPGSPEMLPAIRPNGSRAIIPATTTIGPTLGRNASSPKQRSRNTEALNQVDFLGFSSSSGYRLIKSVPATVNPIPITVYYAWHSRYCNIRARLTLTSTTDCSDPLFKVWSEHADTFFTKPFILYVYLFITPK
jgi:hypothetical protein